MAKLRNLINDQKLTFDTHQAGDGQRVNWRNVHLEKKQNNKIGKLRVPLLNNERPTNDGMSERDFKRVSSEVKKELKKNNRLLQDLAKTISDTIERFSNGQVSADDCSLAAEKFADFFDLSPRIKRMTERHMLHNKLDKYTTIHKNPANEELVIIEQSGKTILIGQLTNQELKKLIKNYEI